MLTARDIALEMVSHLDERCDLDATEVSDTTIPLPRGALAKILNCLNDAAELMRVKCPAMFKRTLGLNFPASTTGTLNVTAGERLCTLGTLAEPADGCTISITGDSTLNEIRPGPDADGNFYLLYPFAGSTGEQSATVYGDSVEIEVDRVLNRPLLNNGAELDILGSRREWLACGITRFHGDYGVSSASIQQRQPGLPRGLWIEPYLDENAARTKYRARLAPMPLSATRVSVDGLVIPRALTAEDLAEGAEVYIPVPGNRDSIWKAIAMYKWSGSPWFRNDSARKVLADEYGEALAQLAAFNPNAAAGVTVRYGA